MDLCSNFGLPDMKDLLAEADAYVLAYSVVSTLVRPPLPLCLPALAFRVCRWPVMVSLQGIGWVNDLLLIKNALLFLFDCHLVV